MANDRMIELRGRIESGLDFGICGGGSERTSVESGDKAEGCWGTMDDCCREDLDMVLEATERGIFWLRESIVAVTFDPAILETGEGRFSWRGI